MNARVKSLLTSGPEVLTEAELLAILIGSGSGKVTAVDLAKTLFVEHKSLGRLPVYVLPI